MRLALLAQLVEQLTLNQWVQGSNPESVQKRLRLTNFSLFLYVYMN